MAQEQGDQIGRIFAYKAGVYFGKFIEITEVCSAKFLGQLFIIEKIHAYRYVLYLTLKGLG
jgi:hypothetical protein